MWHQAQSIRTVQEKQMSSGNAELYILITTPEVISVGARGC